MPATGHRRGNLVYHWKHGYIPLDHFAALQKAHGSKTGAAKLMEKHGGNAPAAPDRVKAAEMMFGTRSKQHKAAQARFGKAPAPTHSAGMDPHAAPPSRPNPVGKDFRSMTNAEKVAAAEHMYGTGSKQHQAAMKKFGASSTTARPPTSNKYALSLASDAQLKQAVSKLKTGGGAHKAVLAEMARRAARKGAKK